MASPFNSVQECHHSAALDISALILGNLALDVDLIRVLGVKRFATDTEFIFGESSTSLILAIIGVSHGQVAESSSAPTGIMYLHTSLQFLFHLNSRGSFCSPFHHVLGGFTYMRSSSTDVIISFLGRIRVPPTSYSECRDLQSWSQPLLCGNWFYVAIINTNS